LPEALEVHRPGQLAVALDVNQAVEATRQVTVKRVIEVGVEVLEIPSVEGAYQDVRELEGVVLGLPIAARFLGEEYVPQVETVGTEVTVGLRVEGVLGVDGRLAQPI
jgi:hypothetical protein